MRDTDFTKILGWPGYRVYQHEINEAAKTLRLWVRRKRRSRPLICSGCGSRVTMPRELPERFKTATMRMATRTSATSSAAGVVDSAPPPTPPEAHHACPVSPAAPLRLLRFPAVRERTGLSRSTIWRLERRGEFPRHRRISANAVAWVEEEIAQWIQSRVGAG